MTVQSAHTCFTPALKPASNLWISGMSMPPTKPMRFEPPASAAMAPTRNEPSSSRNLSAARLGGGGMVAHDADVEPLGPGRRRRPVWPHEQQRDVDDEEDAEHGQQFAHPGK